MQNEIFVALGRLSDAELHTRARGLAARERDATAQLVAHLAEIERRDVHLREGYASLFVYCRDALGLSEAEAYLRIEAARAARRFPVILQRLAEGAINLTTVKLLSPHLTPENYASVLESARGKKKPEPPLPLSAPMAAAAPPAPPPARPVTPLSPDRYKLQLTIDGDTLEMLRLAKDMLSHAIPSGDDAAILRRALDALLKDLAKKRFADTRRPRRCAGRNPAPPTSLRRSCAWCGCGTAAAARSSERAVIAAASAASFSSITSTRGPWAARPRSTDSP